MSWIVTIETSNEEIDQLQSQLWDQGTNGVAELPATGGAATTLLAGFDDEAVAITVADAFGGTVSPVDPTLWQQPSSATVTLATTTPITIELDTTDAFGHGEHPTTRLILDQLATTSVAGSASTVVDVGCGTGVLAIAALLLGAGTAIAIDNDPAAIAATDRNAERNGVAHQLTTRASIGTQASDTQASEPPLILINMLLSDLATIADEVVALAQPGSTLIASGFLQNQAEAVAALLAPLDLQHTTNSDDWACCTFTHTAPAAQSEEGPQ